MYLISPKQELKSLIILFEINKFLNLKQNQNILFNSLHITFKTCFSNIK